MIKLRALVAALYQAANLVVVYPQAIAGSCVAMFVRRIRTVANGLDPNASSSRYVVYATHDKRNLVADYVVGQLDALARLGYRIVFVSTSPGLPHDEAAKVSRFSWRMIHSRNFGHDFGSYKDGIGQLGPMDKVESLILMNDSCYGPLFDLDGFEQQARASSADIWGITDSWSGRYHLQSYFLRIGHRVLRAGEFRRFWATLLPYQPRALVIRLGEIRFTQYFLRRGMITDVLCPYQEVARRALQIIFARLAGNPGQLLGSERRYLESLANQISKGTPLNPMHSFWDVLLVEFACPFIKGNLLRRNPAHIPGLIDWSTLLSTHTDYDIGLIHRHLRIG